MGYLHGSETLNFERGGQTTPIVRSSVIALIGLAPIGAKDSLKVCLNPTDDAQFGKPVPGFNIPKTLEIIRAIAGNCPVLVVNVFDSTTNTTTVSLEAQTVTNGKLKLAFAPVGGAPSIFLNDGTTPATIVKDTDYTLDEYGNFKVISSAISNSTIYKFTYKKIDASTVTSSQLIGTVNGTTNVRTGMKLFYTAFNSFGFNPKLLIAPTYSSISAIASELKTQATKFKGITYLDEAVGTTKATALTNRGVGASSVFNTSDLRAELLFPWIKTYDTATEADGNYPYSAFMAGLRVKVDRDLGYWYSASNKEISIATGIEQPVYWSINDEGSDANALNAAGITTIAQGYGTGIRTWGNRNASFPTSTSAKNFVSIQRIDDIVSESMELAALKYIDQPITQALIDTIREDGNELMRVLIQRGALLPGSEVLYHPDDNPPSELAAGHITFERKYMGPTPAERITYKSVLDITLLNQFK